MIKKIIKKTDRENKPKIKNKTKHKKNQEDKKYKF